MKNEIKLKYISLSGSTKTDQEIENAINKWQRDGKIPKTIRVNTMKRRMSTDEIYEFYKEVMIDLRIDFLLVLKTLPESFSRIKKIMDHNSNRRMIVEKPIHTIYSLADPTRETIKLRNRLCNAINGKHVQSMLVIGSVRDDETNALLQVLLGAISNTMIAKVPEDKKLAQIAMEGNASKPVGEMDDISTTSNIHNKGLLQNLTDQIRRNYLHGSGLIEEQRWEVWGKNSRKNKLFS